MFELIFNDPRGDLSDVERRLAEQIGADAAIELRILLPTLPAVVRVEIVSRGRVIPQLGYGARATTMHSVSYVLNPDHAKGSAGLLREHLRPALFHECHHIVRGWVMRGGTRPKRFIEGVIHEGLASAFERDAAGHATPWTRYADEVREWVDELMPLQASAPYGEWMFLHPDGRRWIGYRAGVFIADLAMEASGFSAAELAETPCEQILALAGIPLLPL